MADVRKERPTNAELLAEAREIERMKKAEFEAAGLRMFGLGFKTRHAPIKG